MVPPFIVVRPICNACDKANNDDGLAPFPDEGMVLNVNRIVWLSGDTLRYDLGADGDPDIGTFAHYVLKGYEAMRVRRLLLGEGE